MEAYAVHGIDVSHYQSYINWDEVARQNISFSFVKASEGETLIDSLFAFNWQELQRVELKRGAYHFFRANIDGQRQAQHYIRQVSMSDGDLPPVLDVETIDGASPEQLRAQMQTWLDIVETHYRIRPIIYTNLKFYYRYLAGHFDQYPIWLARYSKQKPEIAGNRWHFWQYGNRGRVAGIEGDVDLNVFHGSLEELNYLCLPKPDAVLTSFPR